MHHSGLVVDLCRVLMRGRASSSVTFVFGLARLAGVLQPRGLSSPKAGGGLPVTGVADYGGSMAGGGGDVDSRWQQLYVRAGATRGQSRALAARHWAAQRRAAEILQSAKAARDRAEQVHELWLAARSGANPLRYSAYARLQARLASMPAIEQAKGIIVAQFGWPRTRPSMPCAGSPSGRTSRCGTWPPRSWPPPHSRDPLSRTHGSGGSPARAAPETQADLGTAGHRRRRDDLDPSQNHLQPRPCAPYRPASHHPA